MVFLLLSVGAWIITSGYNEQIYQKIGSTFSEHQDASKISPILLGMTSADSVEGITAEDLKVGENQSYFWPCSECILTSDP